MGAAVRESNPGSVAPWEGLESAAQVPLTSCRATAASRVYHIADLGKMIARLGALCIICNLLTACAHDNTIPPPSPAPPDPRICAPLEDPPPIQGGIVQPTTQEQVDAVTEFLRGEADLWSYAGRGWFRAGLAKQQYCPP
jgi:hypothetical protein